MVDDDDMYSQFKTFLQDLAPLPDSEWESFRETLSLTRYNAGETFISLGGEPGKACFVVKGLMKAYYSGRKGDIYIRNFPRENSFAIAYTAMLAGFDTSDIEIVAIEDSTVIEFRYSDYQSRLTNHWSWQQIGRLMAEQHYLMRERRQFELLTMSAQERFRNFLNTYPDLVQRINQKDLAAYLGITPVSLSRMRSQMQKQR